MKNEKIIKEIVNKWNSIASLFAWIGSSITFGLCVYSIIYFGENAIGFLALIGSFTISIIGGLLIWVILRIEKNGDC